MIGLSRYLFLIVCSLIGTAAICRAQNATEQVIADSTVSVEAPVLDSSLIGVNVFSVVEVNQPDEVRNAFHRYVENNKERKLSGYRVRIFFDNSQDARARSEEIAREFAAEHPSIKVYRSHISPYFKVTVGDFRSKIEATAFAKSISDRYTSVFLVKENIQYPEI